MTISGKILDDVNAPAHDAAAITPSDSTVVAFRAIYVGTGGDVVVVTYAGSTVTFKNCPAGLVLPVACTKVKAATTASNLVGLV